METVILGFFILFTLYLIWLLAIVYKFDFRTFLSLPPPKSTLSELKISENIEILGKTEVKFLDKLPEPKSIKPQWEIPLDDIENTENIVEPGIGFLSKEEQEEIISSQEEETSYWQDDESSQGFSIDDVYHAAETIAGVKISDNDITRTKNTLKHFSEEWIKLLSLHASNDKRIKDMLSEYLDTSKNSPIPKTKLKDFIVEDYIA